jgi:hypothetical protein
VLTVVERVAPQITQPPADVTILAGKSPLFSVTATGSTLSYQWQRSSDGGQSWVDTVDTYSFTPVPERLALSPAQSLPEHSGDQFRVVVSNGVDEPAVSRTATLTVETQAPQITSQPRDRTVFEGATVALSTGFTAGPHADWTWQRSTDDGETWSDFGTVLAAQHNQFAFEAALEHNGNLFRASGDNGIGEPAVSDPMALTVLPDNGREVVAIGGTPIDADAGGTLQVIGTGFLPDPTATADTFGLRADLVETGTFTPGGTDFIDSRTFNTKSLESANGRLDLSFRIPAEALDRSKGYELRFYNGADLEDRTFDYTMPVAVEGQDEPSPEPTVDPTAEPTGEPTVEPTDTPTEEPTDEPTNEPTDGPDPDPTSSPDPTGAPTDDPTEDPTQEPTEDPTTEPTEDPTSEPTPGPTDAPGQYDESDLTEETRGLIDVPATGVAGEPVVVGVGVEQAGTTVDPVLFSEPMALEPAEVREDGTIVVVLPTAVEGDHRFAVYADGQTGSDGVIGWDEIAISADSQGDGGTDDDSSDDGPSDNGAPDADGPDSDGPDSDGPAPDSLPRTGGGALGAVGIGAALLLVGAAAVTVARRRSTLRGTE